MRNNKEKNNLIKNSLIYLLSNIINASIPFLLLPILTRHLLPHEYGEVAMFQTFLGTLGAIIGISSASAAARKYHENNISEVELNNFITSCIQITLASLIAALAIIYILSENLRIWFDLKIEWVILAPITSAAYAITQIQLGQWQARKKAISYGALQITQSLINMGLSIILVIWINWGSDGRILAQIFSFSITAIISLHLLNNYHTLAINKLNLINIKEILKYGVPLIPHIAGAFVINSIDRFVINAELGLSSVGIYMVGVQLASIISIFFDALQRAYTPWLYESLNKNSASINAKVVAQTYLWIILISFISLVAFFVAPDATKLIAGEKYEKAGQIIGWLILGQAFMGMYLLMTGYILYSKKTGALSTITIATSIIHTILIVILIKLHGIKGAAIAFSLSMFIRFLSTWWIAQRCNPMPWFSFNTTK